MGISRNRLIGSIGVAALVAGALVVTPTAANGLAPAVDLTFLNINDFHGRIDANTVKFAGTVEQLRAAAPGPVAFLSAGDNISASLFASAVADDQPTIDVLNALDLDASAVGNHEFDKGFDDLTNRVIGADPLNPNADWKYLGANVYAKGTQTPVLPEYQILDMGGISRRGDRRGHPGDPVAGLARRHHDHRRRRSGRGGQPGRDSTSGRRSGQR